MPSTLIDQIAESIKNFEASDTNPNTAGNNNPGNLVYSNWEQAFGGTPGSNGFAAFPDAASGLAALKSRVSTLVNSGASISSLVSTWAGTQYGNSQASVDNYTSFIAKGTGVSNITAPLNSLTGADGTAPASSDGTAPASSASGSTSPATSTTGGTAGTSSTPATSSSISFTDFLHPQIIIAAIIGIICLAGGVIMLATGKNPVQIASAGVGHVAKGAAALAV